MQYKVASVTHRVAKVNDCLVTLIYFSLGRQFFDDTFGFL